MDKEEKKIIMNGIHNSLSQLERLLPILRQSCNFGLQKAKYAIVDDVAMYCRMLAEDLEEYSQPNFKLDDMQDYNG